MTQEAVLAIEKSLLKNNSYNSPGGNEPPIGNLPNELLASIFQLGVNLEYEELEKGSDEQYDMVMDSSGEESDDDDGKVHDCQVIVSHVCHSWRSLALTTPNLWTILSFSKNPIVGKAKEYIIRSKCLTLTINFDSRFVSPHTSQILDLIEPEVSRWRAFTYRHRSNRETRLLMSRLHEMPEATLLESFRILLYLRPYESQTFWSHSDNGYLPFQGQAPNLKEAVFREVPIDWDRAPPSFLRGLRKLELRQMFSVAQPSHATLFQLIINSTELHTLALYLSRPLSGSHSSLDSLTIPSLRELHLRTHIPENITALVEHLSLPNLHTLGLDLWSPVIKDWSGVIRALSSWSNGRKQSLLQSISCLRIFGLSCDIATSALFLSQLEALKTLKFESLDYSRNEEIFVKLTMPVATGSESSNLLDGVLCPKLEELMVSGWNGEKLMAFISARRNAGVPLKRIVIWKSGILLTKELNWIRKNVEHLVFVS